MMNAIIIHLFNQQIDLLYAIATTPENMYIYRKEANSNEEEEDDDDFCFEQFISEQTEGHCINLNLDDEKDEYIFFQSVSGENVSSWLYVRDNSGNFMPQFSYAPVTMSFAELRANLQADSLKLLEPKWKDIQIGEERINTSRASELY